MTFIERSLLEKQRFICK